MEMVNSILDILLFGLIITTQYISSVRIKKLDVEIDFLHSTIEQLETRVIQNEKKKK